MISATNQKYMISATNQNIRSKQRAELNDLSDESKYTIEATN